MFLAYDLRTGDLLGQVCAQVGDDDGTVVIFNGRTGNYTAVSPFSVKIERVN